MNKLVSIVSPCYNGEKYISRYIEAILSQTYRPLELILVNDGSTDKTDEIISSYKEKIEADKRIVFKYIKKENGGPGSAINAGLSSITGEYLIWPDTDDILLPKSIELRVDFLEKHQQYGFVCSKGNVVSEGNLSKVTSYTKPIVPKSESIFFNVLTGKNAVYNPCGYMIRMTAFDDVNPEHKIFSSHYGQNIQMLLPVSYKYKCGYLDEITCTIVDRSESLSKRVWTESNEAWKNRILGLNEITIETLKQMGDELLPYIPFIEYRNLRILSATADECNKTEGEKYSHMLGLAKKLLIREFIKDLARKTKFIRKKESS